MHHPKVWKGLVDLPRSPFSSALIVMQGEIPANLNVGDKMEFVARGFSLNYVKCSHSHVLLPPGPVDSAFSNIRFEKTCSFVVKSLVPQYAATISPWTCSDRVGGKLLGRWKTSLHSQSCLCRHDLH
jgi:hypothetical protein